MIEAHDLTRRYGDFTAVSGISFSVQEGEILGMLGPNGAGKTTTMRILATLDLPQRGDARIGFRDIEMAEDADGEVEERFGRVELGLGHRGRDATAFRGATRRRQSLRDSRIARERTRSLRSRGAATFTSTPRISSASCWNPIRSRSVRPASSSTRRSTSLSGVSSPRAMDPKTRRSRMP